VSSVYLARQIDERDAGHKAEISKLQVQVAELLEEKEQREGQLKKTQELLVTSEAKASTTKTEQDSLKEQTTRWEVDIARLNADFASKLQILSSFTLPDIFLSGKTLTFLAYKLCRHILQILTSSLSLRHLPCLC
jgi:hypothetical protein